jgi:hypothetical protein
MLILTRQLCCSLVEILMSCVSLILIALPKLQLHWKLCKVNLLMSVYMDCVVVY